MKHLLNTLFVTTEDAYLSLDGENVVVSRQKQELARFPMHRLNGILLFSYAGASPALMGACAKREVGLSFCTPYGKFLARTCGETSGNVLLRRAQYRVADNPDEYCRIARTMIFGKVYNCRWVIERIRRDHAPAVEVDALLTASAQLKEQLPHILEQTDPDALRGLEGAAAETYFGVFDKLILNPREEFRFTTRNRRPPLDRVNALLSFSYGLLASECASALESVGLDAYVGFLHRDRAGRRSLALDLMEELRPCIADRFVLTLLNNRMLAPEDFTLMDSGAVLLGEKGRSLVLKAWQERKKEIICHPYLQEKLPWGLVSYVQALLLARKLRGDLDDYPVFTWK